MKNFKHSGDYGDMVFALALIQEMGGGNIYSIKSTATRIQMDSSRLAVIKPLLQSQKYVGEVGMLAKQNIDYDLDDFRPSMFENLTYGKTLGEYHLDLYGLPKTLMHKAWLTITPKSVPGKKVVINRTERYRSKYFPWKRVVSEWGSRSVFVGAKSEYEKFVEDFGEVDYQPTANLLEAAEFISGATWFVGNQSVCNAIAEGLKKNLIQETWAQNPDCVIRRPNAMHIAGEYLVLPEL